MALVEPAANGVLLSIRVRAGSQQQGIVGEHDGRLKVHVHAAPEAGKANKSVLAVVAKAFGAAKSAVTITAGAASSQKRLHLHGVDAEAISARIAEILGPPS